MVAALVFAGFLLPTGLAIWLHDRPWVRPAYVAYLLVLISLPGLGVLQWHWPFFSWHLYAYRWTEEFSFPQVRVVDAAGRELNYDPDAAPPTLMVPVVRFGQRLTEMEPKDALELEDFLVEKANIYADGLRGGKGSRLEWLRFPPHQFGFQWDAEMLEPYGEFVDLRVYQVDVRLSEDGKELRERKETLIYPAR